MSSFWANRRAGVAAEAEAERASVAAETLAEDHAQFEGMEEAEILAALDLPDPDTLVQGDDFSVFMQAAVPDLIRRRALRALWRSNPVLANVDMLVDYGEDFTDAATVVENMQTAYQVGKGMLKHVEELARKAAEPEIEDQSDLEPEDMVAAYAEPQEAAAPVADVALAEAAPEMEMDEDEDAMTAPMPRRMKFRIEETA